MFNLFIFFCTLFYLHPLISFLRCSALLEPFKENGTRTRESRKQDFVQHRSRPDRWHPLQVEQDPTLRQGNGSSPRECNRAGSLLPLQVVRIAFVRSGIFLPDGDALAHRWIWQVRLPRREPRREAEWTLRRFSGIGGPPREALQLHGYARRSNARSGLQGGLQWRIQSNVSDASLSEGEIVFSANQVTFTWC